MGAPSKGWSSPALIFLATLLTATITPQAAIAEEHPTHVGIVADQPVNYTPNILNGHVSAVVQVGERIIAAGHFSKVERNGHIVRRRNIVAFSATTGRISRVFKPSAQGEVYDLELTPDQLGLVAVGNFDSINSEPGTSKVALINLLDGSVNHTFRTAKPNDTVRDIAYANGLYYIAGEFTKLGDHARRTVAALGPKGRDTGIVHLNFQGTNNGGQTKAESMDVTPDGTQMVVAGNFATIDDVGRAQVAVIDLTPTSATLNPWKTMSFAPICGPRFDSYMREAAIDPTGQFFVIVATGGPNGRQPNGLLCDTASRWELTQEVNQQPTWINYTGGDTLTAAIVDTNVVYVGGHMRWLNNSYGHNDPREGAVPREGVAALDPANGLPYTWNPGRRRGYGVFGFALTEDGLWTGSDTTGFGGELRSRIAFCRIATGEKLPPYTTGTLPGTLVLLGAGSTSDVLARDFGGVTIGDATQLASTQQWQNVRGTFVVDDVLYSGWANGTMRAQTFDGSNLGASTPVDLRKGFLDLPDVRAMFFDRATHRIYYTRQGSSTLYYRYFQPESRLVGSWRYEVAGPSQVDWGTVTGGFIVGTRLFYASSDGNLRRVDWAASPGITVGSPTALLGPGIDGTDFRAAGLIFTG